MVVLYLLSIDIFYPPTICSNFMINLETGGVTGIDFGHAFHSATQVAKITHKD